LHIINRFANLIFPSVMIIFGVFVLGKMIPPPLTTYQVQGFLMVVLGLELTRLRH
jgi:hypothetical protein